MGEGARGRGSRATPRTPHSAAAPGAAPPAHPPAALRTEPRALPTAAQDAPDADTARTTELQSLKRLVEDIYEGDVCGGFRECRLMSRAGPWCRAVVQGLGGEQGRGREPWW